MNDEPAGGSHAFAESLALLRTRRFGTFCLASLLSNLGTWAQQVAEPWLLLSLAASSFVIGLDSFAAAAPLWMFALIGGVMADRADRRRIIATCQSIQALCPVTLVGLLVTGTVQPWMIIALSAVVGLTDALSMPSFQSIVPSIVEHDQIAPALAVNATQLNLSRVLGPALAGVLMASVGAIGCFAANAASYLPFIWVALWILPRGRMGRPDDNRLDPSRPFAGIGTIARMPHLRGALLTVLVSSMLCGPLVVFTPVLVRNVLHGDVSHFSASMGAFGLGGMLGAIVLLGIDARRDRRRISWRFATAYGLVLVLAAVNPISWLLPAVLALAGLSMTVSNTAANSMLQATTLPELRGETASLYMLAMRGGLSIGSLMTGLSIGVLGVREALAINGIGAVVAQIAVGRAWLRSPMPQARSNLAHPQLLRSRSPHRAVRR